MLVMYALRLLSPMAHQEPPIERCPGGKGVEQAGSPALLQASSARAMPQSAKAKKFTRSSRKVMAVLARVIAMYGKKGDGVTTM